MSGITFDFWYGDKLKDCDKIKVYFCDLDCKYRGNLYKNGEAVGDFVTESSVAIEKRGIQHTTMITNWYFSKEGERK